MGEKTAKWKEKSKEAKLRPSDDELRDAICEILTEVDFNTATFTDILRQLGMLSSIFVLCVRVKSHAFRTRWGLKYQLLFRYSIVLMDELLWKKSICFLAAGRYEMNLPSSQKVLDNADDQGSTKLTKLADQAVDEEDKGDAEKDETQPSGKRVKCEEVTVKSET
ncbi:hypothetical protein RHGRI_009419 [Rhododendron griersonianum]|uniref:DEK-C domain-containing protein n=1 Tax=Rhododendron griersonianum TaxID=479676 RepID=A0AAV6KFD2_9ERIC|nr:hypothetical protein RHGRI_009419 [Rhododendron griersonianum]